MQQSRRFAALWRAVLLVSVIYTALWPLARSLALCEGDMWACLCASVCLYSSWWLMQGKSTWVKTTSVRCGVQEARIYSRRTKLPSNLLFLTPLQGTFFYKLEPSVAEVTTVVFLCCCCTIWNLEEFLFVWFYWVLAGQSALFSINHGGVASAVCLGSSRKLNLCLSFKSLKTQTGYPATFMLLYLTSLSYCPATPSSLLVGMVLSA